MSTSTTPTTTTTNTVVGIGTTPDTTSCTIQPTSDDQLNYNLVSLVKLIVESLQDGTVTVKNSQRLQNLTVDDILALAKKNSPVQDINNYITQNGTNIIEMIQSYNITRDTKFVTSGYIPFKVITRREPDPSDPTGVTQREIPYIQAKLPYDIINKDRIVSIHLTTRDTNATTTNEDTNANTISNDVIFDYTLDIDPTDPKAAYLLEARAKKLVLGKTQVYDVKTYPNDKTKWGTWSTEKYIQVVYLVDTNWISIPQEELPDITVPNVAMTTSSPVIPMTYSLTNQPIGDPTSKPQESVNLEFKTVRMPTQSEKEEIITVPKKANIINDPAWMLIEDPVIAKQFEAYTKWFTTASKVLEQQTASFTWSPDSEQIGLIENVNLFIMPNNKIINQFTYDMVKQNYVNWGKSIGLSSKIIEMTSDSKIHFDYVSTKPKYGTINGKETEYGLLVKLNAGEQYPFMAFQAVYIPARIIEGLTYNLVHNSYTNNLNIPTRIIEELVEHLHPVGFNGLATYVHLPSRVINFLMSTDIYFQPLAKKGTTGTKIIEEDEESKTRENPIDIGYNYIKLGTRIINENIDALLKTDYKALNQNVYIPTRIINEIENKIIDLFNETEEVSTLTRLSKLNNIIKIQTGKLFIYKPAWIINQESMYPMKMEVSSGSVYYIQDLYNMRVISSLATEEMIPLVTAEGRQQRSEYEFIAEQDQRVFTVTHTPDLVTVFRQGFKLSHGDFYSNGYKIILKSPANAGEVINIVSEKRYVFSNTVSKEELENALTQFKTDRPIITYPGVVYENSTAEIKIQNYDPSSVYTVSIKFEGKYRDDILWTKRGDTLVVDIPEITNVARRTLSVIVYSNTMGKLQSLPTEAIIHIKNLFDVDDAANGQDYKRLIFGAVPTEWYGMENLSYKFDDHKTPNSTYSTLNALSTTTGNQYNVPARIGIAQNKYYQTTLINSSTDKKFSGTYLNAYVGIENLVNIRLDIISSNGNETVFAADYTHDDILKAFDNGTLYFIVDASTTSNDANYQIPNGPSYGDKKYSYRPALEYTPILNILPRTDATATDRATWYLEHNNKLRGRNIHAAIIVDFTLQTDFDFDGFANISESSNVLERTFPLENIEYKVQDEIPFLMGTINDPRIPNLTNPYVNIGSKISVLTGNTTLDANQKDNLVVNNIYAEKIFSGLHTDLSPKDNFNETKAIMSASKYYKKYYPFSYGTIYETDYKKDFFMLNEEDVSDASLQTKVALTMARFYSDLAYATDNPTYSIRLKELCQIPTTSDSFKAVYAIPSEDYSARSKYQANLGVFHYGGSADYVIDTSGKTSNLIEQKFNYQKIYIENSETIVSGQVPTSSLQSKDGYNVIVGTTVAKRIPTWWDVVLRPSVREARQDSLRNIWYLIRDNISLSDPRWLKITDGILRKPKVVMDENLNGMIHRDHEVLNVPDQSQIFLMGGEGYRPTLVRKEAVSVNWDYLNSITPNFTPGNPGKYFVNEAKWAYSHKDTDRGHTETQSVLGSDGKYHTQNVWVDDHGWKGQTEIMKIGYGWENGEPYVEFVWGSYYTWRNNYETYTGIKLYVDRVSRVKCVNPSIYHMDLSKLDTYNPGDNNIFPEFITKIYNSDYTDLYMNPASTTERIADMAGLGTGLVAPYKDRPNFMDTVYESGAWWLTIKPAYSKDTHIYRMQSQYSLTGSAAGGILVSSFSFKDMKNLNYNNGASGVDPTRINANYSKWSLIPDITGMLRGDGPILIKHTEQTPLAGIAEATYQPGIYYFDTWDNYVYKKSDSPIPITSVLFGVKEVMGIRNPYIIQFDPFKFIEDKIDIVGSRFFIIAYLDKYLSTLTKEEFLQFKEELLHINNNASTANPNKLLTIYENITSLKIRAILPEGDNYKANAAQVIMERIATQTGRPASNFVFRLTNNSPRILEVDSIRFTTI